MLKKMDIDTFSFKDDNCCKSIFIFVMYFPSQEKLEHGAAGIKYYRSYKRFHETIQLHNRL